MNSTVNSSYDSRQPHNLVFTTGENFTYNACVGINGWQYLARHAEGYLDSSLKLIKSVYKENSELDLLIYPICFSLRHAVELYLKDWVEKVYRIYINHHNQLNIKVSASVNQFIPHLNDTHSLCSLWLGLREMIDELKIHFNMNEIDQLGKYIYAIAEVDSNGQVFRYPFDKEKNLTLASIYTINIVTLEDKINKIKYLIEKITYKISEVGFEISSHVFTKKLTREKIFEISKKLPKFQDWKKSEFKNEIDLIKKEYSLSSNELNKAIDLIKGNRRLSMNIGVEIAFDYITLSDFKYLIKVLKCGGGSKSKIKKISRLCLEKRQELNVMLDVGSYSCIPNISEQFQDYYLIEKERSDSENMDLLVHYLRKSNLKSKFINAMKLLGADSYLDFIQKKKVPSLSFK